MIIMSGSFSVQNTWTKQDILQDMTSCVKMVDFWDNEIRMSN